ncbi:MAG: hypothetical protein HQL58_01095 [Magnetococcales bacterium]|nr:hypothetical protein [Magnetococcales bacterium]
MPTVVFGLIALALGLLGLSTWWWSVVELLRGLFPLLLILLGLVALGAGISKMRDNGHEEKTDVELTENSLQSDE